MQWSPEHSTKPHPIQSGCGRGHPGTCDDTGPAEHTQPQLIHLIPTSPHSMSHTPRYGNEQIKSETSCKGECVAPDGLQHSSSLKCQRAGLGWDTVEVQFLGGVSQKILPGRRAGAQLSGGDECRESQPLVLCSCPSVDNLHASRLKSERCHGLTNVTAVSLQTQAGNKCCVSSRSRSHL